MAFREDQRTAVSKQDSKSAAGENDEADSAAKECNKSERKAGRGLCV